MGVTGERKLFLFNGLAELLLAGKRARREVIAAGSNCLVSIMVSGNNSGPHLLTVMRLIRWRGNEPFTKACRARGRNPTNASPS